MTKEEKRVLFNWCKKKKKEFDWYPLTMHTIIYGNPNKDKIELIDEFIEKISEL